MGLIEKESPSSKETEQTEILEASSKFLRVAESIWGAFVVLFAVFAGLLGCVYVPLGVYSAFESKGASLVACLVGVFFLLLCYAGLRSRFDRR